jgi:lipopolysaccharide heptosyltransferase II
VRLDRLGDLLMTTPARVALKEARPGRRICLLTSARSSELAALIPEVDEVLTYEAPWMKASPPRKGRRSEESMAERLRQEELDAAVVFTVYSQNPLPAAYLCFLAEIPLRLAHCRENPYQLLTNWVADTEPEGGVRHEVRRQLDLVAAVGCRAPRERMSLSVPAAAQRNVHALLKDLGLAPRGQWLAVHTGASASSRRYPVENFAEVCRLLLVEMGRVVVFTGTEPERELVEGIRSAMGAPSHSLVGRLSMAELAAFYSLAPLLISNNTGPAHVAAAMGTPVVSLYALTNPQHAPWGVPCRVLSHDVSCKYCYQSVCPEAHHDCLRLIEPKAVVTAARELLAESKQDRAHADAGSVARILNLEEP